jgi:hexokinase
MTTFRKAVIAALVKSLLRGKSLIQAILAYWISPLGNGSNTKTTVKARVTAKYPKSVQEFLKEAETALLGPVSGDGLLELSAGLKEEVYRRSLRSQSEESMLPSFSHQLPTGAECGQYLALDVGGSTLRVALVELRGSQSEMDERSEIVSMRNFSIVRAVKDLEGMAFFDWMAARILEVVEAGLKRDHSPDHPLPIALAWSFPIE